MDLGATPYQALTKVIVPMIKEGIFAGALLAFTMSFDDFVISYFVSGNGVKNISIVVYNMTKRINPTINALSTIVIVVIVLVLLFANLIMPKLQASTVKKNGSEKKKDRCDCHSCCGCSGIGKVDARKPGKPRASCI